MKNLINYVKHEIGEFYCENKSYKVVSLKSENKMSLKEIVRKEKRLRFG
jgi:hypothetical protein